MAKIERDTRLSTVLKPLLQASTQDDDELDRSVGLVAEMLAAMDVLILDRSGQVMSGVTDDLAVLGALNTYSRDLVRKGQLGDALVVMEAMERVSSLERPDRTRRPRPPR
ncbi:MAG: hypothetical protein P4M00_17595 [Azospirillaceae bacterium]|nr:hypothetical protein [Azospirillaceae bacterium]